jgi:hypothetical protein
MIRSYCLLKVTFNHCKYVTVTNSSLATSKHAVQETKLRKTKIFVSRSRHVLTLY